MQQEKISLTRVSWSTVVVLWCVQLFPAHAQVDLATSSILAQFKQMSVPVEGRFGKFTVDMQFDPARPEKGKVRVEVDVASYDIGDESYNKEVRGKSWFDAAAFPKALFVSKAIRPAGAGRYSVSGILSIKGHNSDVVLPVVFRQRGAQRIFDGALIIKRLQFNVGDSEWRDTSLIADDIRLTFHLVSGGK